MDEVRNSLPAAGNALEDEPPFGSFCMSNGRLEFAATERVRWMPGCFNKNVPIDDGEPFHRRAREQVSAHAPHAHDSMHIALDEREHLPTNLLASPVGMREDPDRGDHNECERRDQSKEQPESMPLCHVSPFPC